jgi:hypothetical protein
MGGDDRRTDTDGKSPMRPDDDANSAPGPSLDGGLAGLQAWLALSLLGALGAALVRQMGPTPDAIEQLGRQLSGFAARLFPGPDPVRRMLCQAADTTAAMDAAARHFCQPYDAELAELGIEPLAQEERIIFMCQSAMLDPVAGAGPVARPPLWLVAMASDRVDITAAAIMKRGLRDKCFTSFPTATATQEEDLDGVAFVALCEKVLPRLLDELAAVPLAELGPEHGQLVSEARVLRKTREQVHESLRTEWRRLNRTMHAGDMSDRVVVGSNAERRLGSMAFDEAVEAFLRRPGATSLDRRMVAELRTDKDLSAREIARRIGASPRTVQDHYQQFVAFVRERLLG